MRENQDHGETVRALELSFSGSTSMLELSLVPQEMFVKFLPPPTWVRLTPYITKCAMCGPAGLNDHGRKNAKTPTNAPPRTSKAGLIRLRSSIANTTTAMTRVTKPVTAPLAKVKQPARSRPMETGASPRWIEALQGHFQASSIGARRRM